MQLVLFVLGWRFSGRRVRGWWIFRSKLRLLRLGRELWMRSRPVSGMDRKWLSVIRSVGVAIVILWFLYHLRVGFSILWNYFYSYNSYLFVCGNSDGWAFEFQCRPGQHWNANREYCDDPRNAGCDGETQFPQEFPDCPATFVGNVPHPDNCNQYIHCNNGNRFIQRCPHLFNFDIVTARCTVITQANCIDEYRGRRRN